MTEFKLEPIQQWIIQDLVQESLENFLHNDYVLGTVAAIWVDGVIVNLTGPTSCDQEYGDMKNGIVYYEKLVFVKYPKYTKSVKWNGGNYELLLLDYDNHSQFRALTKWIKSQSIWNKNPEEMK